MSVLSPVLPTGQEQKIAGIVKVSAKNADWIAEALQVVRTQMPKLFKFTAEDLRGFLTARDVDPPKHYNAWGALVHTLLREDLIIDTGEHALAKRASAHARRLPIYMRV